MRYIYLHGFASGPHSRKAQAFRTALLSRGVDLECPDLAGGDFEHLTVSGQLRVIESSLRGGPARLVGSSMGGYLAALYASLHAEVDRLVLLAPAFGFAGKWRDERWQETGWREFFHYGEGEMRRVHYGLVDDALRYPADPDAQCATRVFHGVNDTVVPIEFSRAWCAEHSQAELTELESDHELLDVLGFIAEKALPFLTAR